jgi:hypothetical protein
VAPPRWPVINHGRRWRTTRYVRRAAWRQREPHRHPLLRTDAAVIDYQLAQRRDVGASAAHSDVGPAVARTVMSASISARSGSGSPSRPCCAVLYLGWTARHSGRIRPDRPRGGGGAQLDTNPASVQIAAGLGRQTHARARWHGAGCRTSAASYPPPAWTYAGRGPSPRPGPPVQVPKSQITNIVFLCLYGKPSERVSSSRNTNSDGACVFVWETQPACVAVQAGHPRLRAPPRPGRPCPPRTVPGRQRHTFATVVIKRGRRANEANAAQPCMARTVMLSRLACNSMEISSNVAAVPSRILPW